MTGIELAGVAELERPQKRAHRRRRRDPMPSTASVEPARSAFTSSMRPPRQQRVDHGQRLAVRVRPGTPGDGEVLTQQRAEPESVTE